jgi:hypothetical protein
VERPFTRAKTGVAKVNEGSAGVEGDSERLGGSDGDESSISNWAINSPLR